MIARTRKRLYTAPAFLGFDCLTLLRLRRRHFNGRRIALQRAKRQGPPRPVLDRCPPGPVLTPRPLGVYSAPT